MDFLDLFARNLLPVFLAAGAGWLLAARGRVDPRPLAHVGFYVFSPCLVYQLIAGSNLPVSDLLRMTGFAAVSLGVVGVVAGLAARAFGWSRSMIAAVVLVTLLPNAANYGLSAVLFAFGEDALAQASLFFVTSAALSYTVGVLVASMGQRRIGSAVAGLIRVPAVWAVPLALVAMQTGWKLPVPAERTVNLLADATIPVFLVVLGMQLRAVRWRGRLVAVGFASAMRLGGGAVAGLLLARLFGLEGPALQAGVLESAMPSAVIAIILATEYDVEPGFVTSTVLLTTLLSPLTLTPLLAYLGA